MDMLFYDYSPLGALFAVCAIIGGILFVVQLGLQLLGGLGEFHIFDASEISTTSTHIGDSDFSFKWLSVQGLTAFFTMFGLVGLAMEQGEAEEWISLLCAFASGCVSVWVMQRLFKSMGRLQSRGNINMENAIGREGTVYLTISPSERGKVEINIQNRLRVLDAVTVNDETIATGERVRVTRVFDFSVLEVERVALPVSSEEKVS